MQSGKAKKKYRYTTQVGVGKARKEKRKLAEVGGYCQTRRLKKKTKKINDLKKGNLNYPMIENRQKVKAKQLS